MMNNASAAPSNLDSLRKELQRTDDVEAKIRIYLAISSSLSKKFPDSAFHFNRIAMNLAKRLKTEVPLANAYAQAARLEIRQNKLDQAFMDLIMARRYYSNAGKMDDYLWVTMLMGNIYLTHDNTSGALTLYLEIISFMEKNKKRGKLFPDVLNSIGSIFMETEDYHSALGYVTRALSMYREEHNEKSMVYPLMNLGEIYFTLGNLDMSEDYINQTIKLALQFKDKVTESRGYMIKGKIYTAQAHYREALRMLDSSKAILESFSGGGYDGPVAVQYSELMVQLCETWRLAGDAREAFHYGHQGLTVARTMKQLNQECKALLQLSLIHEGESRIDSALFYYKIFISTNEELVKARNVRAVRLMEIRQDFAKKQKENEINIANAESAKQKLIIISVAGGAGFILVILLLILMLKLEKQRKSESEKEKNSLKEKLDYQNKELMTNVMYLTRMNELVVAIAEKLNNLELLSDSSNQKIVQSIIQELRQTTSIESWKDFEVRFQQVHIDFYKKLSGQFPDLSPNDLKMCAFLRLNLSTKEICSMTHQSQDSIRMARSRLRQKLGVNKDENLVMFLTQF